MLSLVAVPQMRLNFNDIEFTGRYKANSVTLDACPAAKSARAVFLLSYTIFGRAGLMFVCVGKERKTFAG